MTSDKELKTHFYRWYRKQLSSETLSDDDLEAGFFVFINAIHIAKQSPNRPLTKPQKRKLESLAAMLQDVPPYTKNALALQVACRLLSDPPFATYKTFGSDGVNTLKNLILKIYDQTEKVAADDSERATGRGECDRKTDAPLMALCRLRLAFADLLPATKTRRLFYDYDAEDQAFRELAEIALLAFDSVKKKYQPKIISKVMAMCRDELLIKTRVFPAEN